MPVLDIEGDAERIWEVTQNGGVALIPIES